MADRTSDTHEHVVVKQDNGELQEDVIPAGDIESGGVDEQSDESFPASDPPSHWSGPGQDSGESRRSRDRIVERRPAEASPERSDPAEPKPQTLPKD